MGLLTLRNLVMGVDTNYAIGFNLFFYLNHHSLFSLPDMATLNRPRKRRRFAALKDASHATLATTSGQSPLPTGDHKLRYAPSWPGCGSVEQYERLNYIDEGTYGRVYRAKDVDTGKIYALKQLKVTQEREGFPVTSLREVSALFALSHLNVVALREVVVGNDGRVYMVLEYCAHDLLSVLSRMLRPYGASEVKSLMLQLLRGVAHVHDNWLMHRDLKPANLLLGADGVLKICDFGLARNANGERGTPGVVTLWYRAPEILFADPNYSCAVDMWSVGCIFAELLLMKPLFAGGPNDGELALLKSIAHLLGPPSEAVWSGFDALPHAKRVRVPYQQKFTIRQRLTEGHGACAFISPAGIQLIEKMLTYDPAQRITAHEAMQHRYFKEAPPPKDAALIQTFPDDRRS